MKIKLITTVLISVFLSGCGSASDPTSKTQTNVSHEEHEHTEKPQSLVLNNAEKWKVNQEMLAPIHHTETLIHDFKTDEKKDYKVLAEKLQGDINVLVSSCNMTGESHEQLHVWLLPYIAEVKALTKAKDNDAAEQQFKHIEASWATYNKYFQ